MWKTFMVNDKLYMLKVCKNDNAYEILLTDIEKIWSCNLSEHELVEKFQKCNPLVETNINESMSYILNMLNEIRSGEVILINVDNITTLNIKTSVPAFKSSKFIIGFELDLIENKQELLTKTFTMPLVQTVIILEKQQQMMSNLLKKKDREIEEYQMEKGEISRTDLITEKFQPENFISSSDSLMLNLFGDYKDLIANKYGFTKEKVPEIEVESWNGIKRKRKIYNKETAEKANSRKIVYNGDTKLKQ